MVEGWITRYSASLRKEMAEQRVMDGSRDQESVRTSKRPEIVVKILYQGINGRKSNNFLLITLQINKISKLSILKSPFRPY